MQRGQLLPGVTGLRFIAAALIMVGHAATVNSWAAVANCCRWWEAVPFFFLLSGFVLGHVYPKLEGGAARRQFGLARFARIYPLHLTTFLLIVILVPSYGRTGLNEPLNVVTNLTLTQCWNLDPACFLAFNSPAWSISVEMFLYACFPLLIYRWKYTWWMWLSVGYLVNQRLDVWFPEFTDTKIPVRYLFEFATGIATASVLRWLAPRVRLGSLAGTGVEAAAFAWLFYIQSQPVSSHYVGISSLTFASVILVVALGQGWISRCLGLKFMVILGEASFALYLLHQIVLRRMLVDGLHLSLGVATFFCLYVGIALLGSYILCRWVERPARKLILGYFSKPILHARAVAEASSQGSADLAVSPASPQDIPAPHFQPDDASRPREMPKPAPQTMTTEKTNP